MTAKLQFLPQIMVYGHKGFQNKPPKISQVLLFSSSQKFQTDSLSMQKIIYVMKKELQNIFIEANKYHRT